MLEHRVEEAVTASAHRSLPEEAPPCKAGPSDAATQAASHLQASVQAAAEARLRELLAYVRGRLGEAVAEEVESQCAGLQDRVRSTVAEELRSRLDAFQSRLWDSIERALPAPSPSARTATAASALPASLPAATTAAAGCGARSLALLPRDVLRGICLHLPLAELGALSSAGASARAAAASEEVWALQLYSLCPSAASLPCGVRSRRKSWLQSELRSGAAPRLSDYVLCAEVAQFGSPVFSATFPLADKDGLAQGARAENLLHGRSLRLLRRGGLQVAPEAQCELRLAHRELGVMALFDNNVSLYEPSAPEGSMVLGGQGLECFFRVADLDHLAEVATRLAGGATLESMLPELSVSFGVEICVAVRPREGGTASELVGALSFMGFNDLNRGGETSQPTEELVARTLFPLQVWQMLVG